MYVRDKSSEKFVQIVFPLAAFQLLLFQITDRRFSSERDGNICDSSDILIIKWLPNLFQKVRFKILQMNPLCQKIGHL